MNGSDFSAFASLTRTRAAFASWWWRLKFELGCWLIGGHYLSIVARLWLIRDRAMAAVSRDGRVTLALCQPLADALYEEIPGNWSFTMTQYASSERETPKAHSPESPTGVSRQEKETR